MCYSHSKINIGLFWATVTYLSSNNVAGNEIVPDSGLINNAGRYVGGPDVPWSRIDVVQGKRYRLRVMNNCSLSFCHPRAFTYGKPAVSIVIHATADKLGGRSLR